MIIKIMVVINNMLILPINTQCCQYHIWELMEATRNHIKIWGIKITITMATIKTTTTNYSNKKSFES